MFEWLRAFFHGIATALVSGLAIFGLGSGVPATLQATTSPETIATSSIVEVQATTTLSEIDQLRLDLEQEKAERLKLEAKISTTQNKSTSKPSSVTPTVTTTGDKKVKTFTTPSGAVLDDAGNVISGPTNTPPIQSSPNVTAGSRILTGEEIYSLVSPSVVLISWGDASYDYAGSGFVINGGKYVLTNAHVLKSKISNSYTSSVEIRLQNGATFKGAVLGKNESADLAIIYNGSQRPAAVTFGTSADSLKIGTEVYALGFPSSFEGLSTVTFTKGTLSAKQQNAKWYSGTLLQMDAAINHGNSGGPLVNNRGEVIGINTFGGPADTQGIYFAIPIDSALSLIPSLSQYGQSRYEVYPIGSKQTIKRSVIQREGINDELTCSELGFMGIDLAMCDLYRSHYAEYQWTIIEDN